MSRTLITIRSSVDIDEDADTRRRRVVSSCLWRRVIVVEFMVVPEGSEGKEKVDLGDRKRKVDVWMVFDHVNASVRMKAGYVVEWKWRTGSLATCSTSVSDRTCSIRTRTFNEGSPRGME